jgi:hypothetical protein
LVIFFGHLLFTRGYRVKTTVSVGVTGFPRGDDSEEVRQKRLDGTLRGILHSTIPVITLFMPCLQVPCLPTCYMSSRAFFDQLTTLSNHSHVSQAQ